MLQMRPSMSRPEPSESGTLPRIWQVGALCRAIADALNSRFNPVRVVGEVSGFARAVSGHCYFSLKDSSGQLRCAMFRRAAERMAWVPRDGDLVEVTGTVGVYEPRGELQLVVDSLARAGQGTFFERFAQLKEQLSKEGLFDARRKRSLPPMPRGIGVVTSTGAAAWHDLVTALQRRVPHIPVVLVPSLVQGAGAAQDIIRALESLYLLSQGGRAPEVDLILLVRGGGSLEDLWAFNDEQLARAIARSPVPLVSGIGHETDFTIADFVADLRAPTPTAAAELASLPTAAILADLGEFQRRLQSVMQHGVDREAQHADRLAARLGRPSGFIARQAVFLTGYAHRLRSGLQAQMHSLMTKPQQHRRTLPAAALQATRLRREALGALAVRLEAQNPLRVLERGYAWIVQEDGRSVTTVRQAQVGLRLMATLADGAVDLEVLRVHSD
jgi:exodeoxyribonuclease VII large subunit